MTEKFSFFDPVLQDGLPDREYNAQEFTDYFATLVTTGVMKGAGAELKVTANGSNMLSEIDTGVAFVEGRYYANTSKLAHTHDTETLGKNRIDRIVVRLDLNTEARYVKSFIKKGIASANPVPPALTRNATVYEISLAQVKVIGGQTYINVADVTDERGNPDVCPWAGSRVLPNFDDSSVGQPNGIATLDASGSVPMEQLQNVPLPQDATTTRKGVVQLNNELTSSSVLQAATPNAVKQVNDKLTAANLVFGFLSKASAAAGQIALGLAAETSAQNAVALGSNAKSLNADEGVLGVTSGGPKTWIVPGNFRVNGTKNFEMSHPHPDKRDTHVIRHGAVESPTAGDTLYRYTIEASADGEVVELQLPDYFQYLNKDVDVWVNGDGHFGRAFGNVEGDILYITCELAGSYKVLVIGTRNDDHESVQTWNIKGVEREIGESWTGETYSYEVDEIVEVQEITQGVI